MSPKRTRCLVVTCGAALLLLGLPAQGTAGAFDWLIPPFGNPCCSQPTVVARPVAAFPASTCGSCATPAYGAYSASACTTCARPTYSTLAPRTVQYPPRTCYRSIIQTVPVGGYCSAAGCVQGCYRPVTAYVRRVQLVPYAPYYSTFSPVCASYPASACYSRGACHGRGLGCYGGCSTGFGVPSATVLSSGCASCASGGSTTVSPGSLAPALPASGVGTVPMQNPAPAVTQGKTFRQDPAAKTPAQKTPAPAEGPKLDVKPEAAPQPHPAQKTGLRLNEDGRSRGAPFTTPHLYPPTGRTTMRPLGPIAPYRPASWTTSRPDSSAAPVVDDGGWRPARDY